MTIIAFVFASAVALGLVGFCTWAVHVYVTSTLDKSADLTTRLVYYSGKCAIWAAALLTTASVFALVVRGLWVATGGE